MRLHRECASIFKFILQLIAAIRTEINNNKYNLVKITATLVFIVSITACTKDDKLLKKWKDDDLPYFVVSMPYALEGDPLVFTVALAWEAASTVTVDYSTQDGTATVADSDYVATSGTLTFAPGETVKTVSVTTVDDVNPEVTEQMSLRLQGGMNYQGSGSPMVVSGFIKNKGDPTITVTGASANEGSTITFNVDLSAVSTKTINVNYSTSDGTATLADSDYTSVSGMLTFLPGETNKQIIVNTTADANVEPTETFTLTLSGGVNYTVPGSTLSDIGSIIGTDPIPTISIAPVSAAEGSILSFVVTLSNPYSANVTIDYATSDGTATLADSDYTSTSGTLTFLPGETTKNIDVNSTADTNYEVDETLTVTLSGGANYTVPGSTLSNTGTITNDDGKPTISIANVSAAEGSGLTFTATLSGKSYEVITIDYATSNGTATVADSDYTSASGTLTFNAGNLTKNFTVNSTADTKYETDETVTATLSGGSNYTVAGSTLSATGTITNDDPVPTISIAATTGQEGGNVVFTVTQSSLSYIGTTFDYASSSSTATSGSDFTATSGSGSIPAGSTTTTISVPATDDSADESDETFTMTISNPANATIGTAAGTGTIEDTVIYYDFMTGSLPGNTTFTRGSAGTYVDVNGNVVSAAVNGARFDHDPTNCPGAVCAVRGLLMEPATTNLTLNSETFSSWTTSNIRAFAANSGDAASPDGVNSNAELVRENANTSAHSVRQNIGTAVAAGALMQFTVYAKNSTASARNYLALTLGDTTTTNYIRAHFDLTGANSPTTTSGGNGGGQLVAEMKDAGNGWKRLRLSGVASTTATALRVTINLQNAFGGAFSYAGNNTSGFNFWGAQLEENKSVPTSYVPTGAATVSRSADSLYVSSFTGFTGGFGDGSAWTMITDFSRAWFEPATTSANKTAAEFCISASCANDRISSQFKSGTRTWGTEDYLGGVAQGISMSGAIAGSNDTLYQLGVIKSAGTLTSYLNGTAYTATGALSYPAVDILYVGGKNTSLSGHLHKFTLRRRAIPNANMLILTND